MAQSLPAGIAELRPLITVSSTAMITALHVGDQANLASTEFFRQPFEQIIAQRDQPMPKCKSSSLTGARD